MLPSFGSAAARCGSLPPKLADAVDVGPLAISRQVQHPYRPRPGASVVTQCDLAGQQRKTRPRPPCSIPRYGSTQFVDPPLMLTRAPRVAENCGWHTTSNTP